MFPIKLSDNVFEDIKGKVQLLKTCTFYHDRYGKVEITRTLLSEMVDNFRNKVRGIEVMIDYAHDSEREAAGWIKNVELIHDPQRNEDQLWADVEWTPKGRRTLADKEFAYLSADFDPDYRDNEAPEKRVGAVLLGAGLTNRPVVKRMAPAIQLSEEELTKVPEEGSLYDIDKKGDHNMEKELEEKKEELKKEMKKEEKIKMKEKEKALMSEEEQKKLMEYMESMGVGSIEELLKAIAGMKGEKEDVEKQLAEVKEEKLKAEKKAFFDELMKTGYVVEAQRDEVMKLSEEGFKTFVDITKLNKPTIKLHEEGHGRQDVETKTEEEKNKSIEELVIEKAVKLAEEKNIPRDKAISEVLINNKELAKKYYEL
jgi:phage I-like protein